jgi:membrane-associated phospholipid phosphatase
LTAVGVAYHFDGTVRAHFVDHSPAALSSNTHDLQDALPAAALFMGTWAAANLLDDNDGRREAGSMIEASVLSVGTAYVLKYAAGRDRPDQSADPGRFRAGGSSFPSVHATAAFAIGTAMSATAGCAVRLAMA